MTPDGATTAVTDSVARIGGEVAVGEDLRFQRRWWRFERWIWIFFMVIIALDLAGVFGRGPVAQATLQAEDHTLKVHYERIERTGTPSMMSVSLEGAAIHEGNADLFVSDTLVGPLGAQRIIPQPSKSRVGNGGLTYTFPVSNAPATVRFELQPEGAGMYAITLGVPGASPVSANILVLP